jgi:hypothetical protein
MITEKIAIVNADLVAGKAVKTIEDISLTRLDAQASSKQYIPIKIKCTNNTNVSGNFIAFSDMEYIQYIATPTITDLVPLAIGESFEYIPTNQKMTTIVVESAVFTGTYDIEIWKE